MRVQSLAAISALAAASLANTAAAMQYKEYERVWTSPSSSERPTVYVTLGDLDPRTILFLPEMKLEWTANGQPMPPTLDTAECITTSAQAYSCQALNQWFSGPSRSGRPGRTIDSNPEGFQLRNMEFDTDYCFRFNIGNLGWGTWKCARTPSPPPPPARPFAPSRPVLTLLPAASGAGQIGGDEPLRILVEWQPNSSNRDLAEESVLILERGDWRPTAGESRPGEKVVVLPQYADPDGVYAIRVCARNASGEACSPPVRTPGRPWLEKSGKASRFPALGGSDTYNPDTPTAIPANRGDSDRFDSATATSIDSLIIADPVSGQNANAEPVVRAQGRVKLPQSSDPSLPTRAALSKCEAAEMASARNSPAAPGLQAQCRALNDLAARGRTIADQDPLSVELRNRQRDDAARRGFDIGMAAAEGHTAPGPGKQQIHDSLLPDEQPGFESAVAFSLERNRYREFATTGAAIALRYPSVAQARTARPDVFYWLGFDIAMGFHTDSTDDAFKGGRSLIIRNNLGESGKSGFDAGTSLFDSGNYRR